MQDVAISLDMSVSRFYGWNATSKTQPFKSSRVTTPRNLAGHWAVHHEMHDKKFKVCPPAQRYEQFRETAMEAVAGLRPKLKKDGAQRPGRSEEVVVMGFVTG